MNKCRQTATELTLSSVAELAKVSELTLSSPIQQELIGQFLINQQGFDVNACEHGLRMACLWGQFSLRKLAICAETGCK